MRALLSRLMRFQCWRLANRQHWNRMSLLNSARMGYFSSDRSVREYCEGIWKASAVPVKVTCQSNP